jgi:RimJ/RimL family protein N-acetyltransferase
MPGAATVFPLRTQRLLLRPFRRSDLPAFAQYRGDPEVARYQSWSAFTQQDAEAFFAQQDGLVFDLDGTWFQVAVERSADGVLLGDVALHFFDEGRQAEIGFTFARAHQGAGYASEAVGCVLSLLFGELGKHRVVATVDVDNAPAARLLERLGFRREGHYIQNVYFKGKWADEYSFALLAHEVGDCPQRGPSPDL